MNSILYLESLFIEKKGCRIGKMGFQEFKENYLKATVPEKKVDLINSIENLINKNNLSFFATHYKNESDGEYEQQLSML